ncbi:MAG: adenylosuccinate lyase [Defluviitaleaceae bacterium]|nr:adenylosuccinate lyase [Defluviitaleaceae bacterium]MCL2274048.1 adenylosuccinate lyase [Defluviitaleaceae bacterium]
MHESYENPLCRRYASPQMQYIFSDANKFGMWRRLWVALAQGQRELGLDISEAQIAQMQTYVSDIDYEAAAMFEREIRHDVMAHIKAYAVQCPLAAPIIHLGATSCYVGDNTDLILLRDALLRVKGLLLGAMGALSDFADAHKGLACLGYTHFQAAQPTTLGKRATLWLQDLLFDFEQIEFALEGLKLLGCRGTTGTGASFLALFDGDDEKVKALERGIAQRFGFDAVYAVSGQTYSRKVDFLVLSVLSGIAQSAYKFSNDVRLMAHLKEVDEPFEAGQVGSSAMAYKRNPMRSERIASLARLVINHAQNPAWTAASQWFERTLDDSANRRIVLPEAFLAVDGILGLVTNIVRGLTVHPKMIEKHLREELPFIATENMLMHCVKKGGDRQALHEKIRVHSLAAAQRIKEEGAENDLLQRLAGDNAFNLNEADLQNILTTQNFTGRAQAQTEEFLTQVKVVLGTNKDYLCDDVEIKI